MALKRVMEMLLWVLLFVIAMVRFFSLVRSLWGPIFLFVQTEAWALREGVKGASSLNISHIIIEGDNLVVKNSMKNAWSIPWEIFNIVNDASIDSRRFEECQFRHCFREENQAADFRAKKAPCYPALLYWFPPYCMDFSLIKSNKNIYN